MRTFILLATCSPYDVNLACHSEFPKALYWRVVCAADSNWPSTIFQYRCAYTYDNAVLVSASEKSK